MKSLDQKLARIRAGNYTPADFIMADAKDPDMAFGIACPGPARDTSGRLLDHLATRPVFLQTMRDMTKSGSDGSPKSLNVERSLSWIAVPVAPKNFAFGTASRHALPNFPS